MGEITVSNIKPTSGLVENVKGKTEFVVQPQVVYTETRTINAGQPLPWGLNWLITYPNSLTFTATRL